MYASETPPGSPQTLESLAQQLHGHEERSQERYEKLCDKLKTKSEGKMGMDNVSDKVNINVGDGGSGGGAGLAALIAAMNSGGGDNNLPGLIAAMNRPSDGGGMAAMLPALMAGQNNGMNNIWPIILLALLGRGRGGLLGGGGEDCGPVAGGIGPGQAALLQTILENAAATRASVPATALETQNALQQAVSALALGTQQGFANTKDAVQASLLANLTATSGVKDSVMNNSALLSRDICDVKSTVQTEACATRELVQAGTTAILSRIDRSEIDDLRARADRAERAIEVNALRSQVEVNQTVTTTQGQAQGQFQLQAQLQDVGSAIRELRGAVNIANQVQLARASQDIVNLGTMTASGTQAAANTQVR